MAGYKSLQVAEAINRISQQLKPQVTVGSIENSVYGQNTNTPTPLGETNRQIEQANQYYNTLYSKTGSDYVQDAAVALGKGIVSVPQAIAGLADLGDAALSAAGTALTGGNPADIQTGRVTKALDDAGLRFKETQDIMNGWYSDGTQKQLQQLAALPGMSTEQSFGENMSSLGQTAGYVLDNPSIALNTIIQSLPAMGAGGAIGRVAGAVAPKVAGAAGAIGEGTIMAGAAQANMDTDEQGYTTAAQSLGALGIGVLGGAVGQLGSRIANRAGADDIDSLAAGVPTQMPKQGFTSLATGTVTEAAEEAAQTSLENVISNISSGKDAIEGLNQDLVLGTFAGAGMGAATNASGSLKSAALEAVMTAAQNQANKIKERVQRAAPEKSDLATEELANPASEKYNPTAAIIRESKGITPEATEEEIQAVKTNMNKVLTDAETHLAGLVERRDLLKGEEVLLKNIEGAKAAVQTFAETDPDRAAKAQGALDNILLPKLEMLNEIKAKTNLEGLEAVISETEKKVTEARDMHTKMGANIQATQDTLANMTPAQKIFAAPTAYSVEEIEAAIQSPDTAPELQQSLRVLADAIVAQNAVKSIDEVNNQIVGKKFDPNYRSTPQYMEQFSAAIRNGSIPTQRNLMREIEAFEQSHVQKAQLVQSGLEQVQQTGKPVQIIRSAAGSWEVNNAEFLKGDAAKKNGAITIHPTPKGIAAMVKTNEYMQAEAAAITATKAAMQAMTKISSPNQGSQQQAAPTFNPAQPMDFTSDDPFQAALDGYNQDMRSTNEWQPNSRSIDPRSDQVLGDTVNPTAGETVIPAEVQPTSGSAPTTNQSTGTPTATQDLDDLKPDLSNTEIQFDESGVGSVVPTKAKAKSASVSEQSVSEATDTEGQTSTDAKPKTTKQQAMEILEGKYSEDTHTVYQKEDGNWAVRKKTFDEVLDEASESVQAFEDYEPQVDEEGEKLALESTEVETEDAVKDVSIREEERTKPIEKRDLIKDGFNRRDTPLAKMPDLHKGLRSAERAERAIKYLTDIEPTQDHINNVLNFSKFREDVADAINGSVKVRRIENPDYVKYQWQDYLQFLVKDDGTFDDDVITAVAGAAYLYVAENAEVKTKTEKEVAQLLRLKNVDSIPHHIFSALAEVGDHRNLVRASLGQRVSASLGYKQVSDVSEVRTGKLNDALGSLVLRSLTEMGIVEITTMPNSDFEAMRKELEDDQGARKENSTGLNDGLTNNFARIVPGDLVTNISKANEKTNSVLSKMLAVKSEFTMPVLEAPTDLIKNSFNDKGTPYPSEAVETTNISQARPYGFMNEMVKVADSLRALDEVEYKRILGFKTETELADMQVMKQLGQKSINDSIDRSLKIVDEFRADLATKPKGVHTPFYLPQFLVSNTRSHYASDLNPQADKIHRGLVGMKDHEVELDTNQQYFTEEGITEMGRFMQAVAMNLEKAPIYKNPLNNEYVTIDKANYKNFIPSMLLYLEQPHVVLAIQAMQNVQKGKGTHSDLTAISAFVKEGGMKMQSLKALQALADFDAAKQYGSKFITDITFESDGVTNGPFLTGISTNTLADNARNAGGLFRDDRLTSVPEYKEGLGQDLYEFLGEVMKKVWADHKKVVNESGKKMVIKAVNALDILYPVFGERKGAKPITTTANYGAGDTSIKAANAREVINNLIDKLDTDDHKKALTFIKAANEIISYTNVAGKFKAEKDAEKAAQDKTGKFKARPYVEVDLISTSASPKSINLTAGQISAIYEFSKNRHGAAIEESLQQGLGDFIPVRNTLTNHASLAFEFFDVLRTDALEAATQRAIEEKTLETVNGKPIESISVKEKNRALREIAKYTPTFTNAMAGVSSNRAQSSTPLMKTEKELLPGNLGKSELHFKDGNQIAHAQISVPANPGVSGLALAIQSMDSFVTHFVMKRIAAQNYHDANASSIKDATKMAQIQNEGVFTALRTMHLSSGMVKAFLTTANGAFDLGSLTADDIFTDGVEEALRKLVNAKKTQQLSEFDLAAEIQQQVMSSFDRDIAKLRELAKEKYVGQYGTQEGHYTITDADRKAIEKEVNKLKADRIRQLEEAARLGKALNEMTGYKKPAKSAESIEAIMKGGIEFKYLKETLQKELSQYTGESNTQAQQYSVLFKELLKMFNTAIPDDLVLKGISVNSPDADNIPNIEQVRENRISAWFGKDAKGKDAIFFAEEAGMPTAKVVVHELLHAATVNAIAQFKANPDKHPEGKVALDRVEKLFNNVKNKVAKDKDASDIVKYGVQNLEEFIATGLTYPEFVDYLAKTQVQSGSRSKLNFTDGFAEFIKSVADVLSTFVKSKVFQSGRMISALEALVYDTTDIIQNSVNMQNDLVPAPVQIDIFGAPQQARASVEGYTSRQVFDALNSNLNPQFKTHLTTMMTHVSDQILGNTLLSNNNGAWTMEQAWQEYIDAGKTETTETAVTAGFRMTEQETFAVESLFASIKAGIKDKAMTQVYAEMDKAYKSAKAKMKVEDFYEGDWATATKDDRETAQDKYDFLFKLGPQNPEHLSRFVAMALGSEYVNGKLGFAIKDTTAKPDNVFQRLVEGTNDLVNYVSGLMTNSSVAGTVNSKLSLLSQELAQIDSKHRNFAVSKVEQQIEQISDMADNVSNKLRDKVTELAEKDVVANSRFTAVRFASHTTRLAAKGDLWTTLDVLKEASSYENPNQRLGFLGEVVNEAANNDSTKDNFEYLMRLTKLNNQMKENLRDATTKNVMSTFEENGAYLTKEDKHSLTNFLRIDTQSLLDNYSVSDIAKMYSNGQYLHSQIRNLESQVTGKDSQIMINRAKQLAKYMVTGKSSPGLAKNAQLIVSGFNSGEVVDLSNPNVALIDQIATLYAIEYTNIKDKARLNSIFKRELKNGTNGIDTSLKFHRELSQVARENLFADNAVSMIKGFVPEITNPNREVRIANNDVEAKLYKDQFYKEVKSLTKDKRDPSSHNPRLFLTEEANIQRLVSGAVEVVSTNRKGTSVVMDNKQQVGLTKNLAASFPTSPNYNPMHDQDVAMVPNYDTQGNVIGYSYEMSAEHRDSYLERNNDFSELLGAYAATNFNKQKVPEQNAKVIDALYEDYSTNFKENPRAYVNVGPNSQDPGLREMWAMLPQATRDHVRNTFAAEQVYGQGGMMIRQDLLLMIFGYRKYSLNQSFDKMNEARNMFEKLYVGIMKTLFEDNAKVRGVQIERSWQEAVRLLKDIIVIRNVKTMLFNTMSNGMLLMAHGISPTDIVRDSLTAVRAGTQYRKDMANLIAIRQKQRAGVGNFNQLEQEALKLEDSINRNPLKGFIEEGMMPTIVEDVDPEMDHYSYKTKMQEKIEGYTSQVPKSVRTAAKWAFVSPDTPIYQFLNNATQFSDFSAKYSMYKYYTEKAKDKLEHKAALQIASDNFINYDVPTAKGLQYLNDMGVVMFTKYNMRIQKALFQLLKKRPATAMAQALFINSFTNLESGIDPLIWFNLGNPLREGAFGLPSVLDEPFPIKILSGM